MTAPSVAGISPDEVVETNNALGPSAEAKMEDPIV